MRREVPYIHVGLVYRDELDDKVFQYRTEYDDKNMEATTWGRFMERLICVVVFHDTENIPLLSRAFREGTTVHNRGSEDILITSREILYADEKDSTITVVPYTGWETKESFHAIRRLDEDRDALEHKILSQAV